jgi:TolB-like protein/Flp pilus assembly protein TadD
MTVPDQPDSDSSTQTGVFFSYARADRKRAMPIIAAIEAAGYRLWWDGLLEGGERFAQTTQSALENAQAVVVLWTKTSIDSHWVHDEATRGRDRRCLVPLTLDGVEPPLGFRQFQAIDLSGMRAKTGGYDQLIRAIALLHDQPPAPLAAAQSPTGRAGGIDRRMLIGGAVGVAALGGAAAWWSGLIGGGSARVNSVAVLPFDNLSRDTDITYFSDGLAAEVRSRLARNPLLQVAAQASSNRFRASDEDIRTISRQLRVGFVLDGNVRREGGTLRISAELIDGATGFPKWTQTFDGPVGNVFAIQEQIAGAVTSALTAQMIERSAGDAKTTGATTDLAAYDAFLRGKDLFDRASDEASDRGALAAFDAAIAADPRYAIAHAERSRVLAVIGNQYDQGATRRATYAASIAAGRRAVELAPDIAEPHSALGFAVFNGSINARAARGPFERSYALGSGDAELLSRYGLYSGRCGRFDSARQAMTRAATLDPLNARLFRRIGDVEYSARAYAAAIPPIERALQLNPDLSVARSAIGACRLMLGDVAGARTAYESETNSLFKLTGLAIIAHKQQRRADAEAAMQQMIAEHGDNSLYQQAQILAQWGDTAAALDRLDAAVVEIDAGLMYAQTDPFVDPLRRDPRFVRLLDRLGFGDA